MAIGIFMLKTNNKDPNDVVNNEIIIVDLLPKLSEKYENVKKPIKGPI